MGVIYGYHGPLVLLEQLWEEEESIHHRRFFSHFKITTVGIAPNIRLLLCQGCKCGISDYPRQDFHI